MRVIWLGVITGFSIFSVIGLILLRLSADLPDLDQLRDYEPRLTTQVLDRNGVLLKELYTQQRLIVPLSRVPDHTVNAILSTEDNRFYSHWGMDTWRVASAALIDIMTFSVKQGASTITQQLARDLYLHKRRTFSRKIREILTALQIERNYSKREIMEMYLTQIYFGHGAYGIGSAAQKFFGKIADSLSIQESALLAALPKAPSRYSPRFHPERALSRRNLVLNGMLRRNHITPSEYRTALEAPIEMIPRDSSRYNYGIAPYFTEMIRQELSVEGTRLGFDYLEDGLRINTTLDANMQEYAEIAVRNHFVQFQPDYRRRFIERSMKEIVLALYDSTFIDEEGDVIIPLDTLLLDSLTIDSMYSNRSIVQVAMVVLDPHNGDILAMIGGRDFGRSKFNRAVQAIRQPGSIFKPFTYVAAIDNGYPTTFELLNQDVVIVNDDGTRWVPQNYDLSHGGPTTLREALRRSLNLIAVRLIQEVVPSTLVRRYARQMGISTPVAAVDAIALGASGVYPIEMTASFSAFGNGGILCTPRGLLSVEDRYGDEISSYPPKRKVALSEETAYIMTDMLSTVINRGTGGSSRWKWHFYKNAAGKTGTTNDFTDAWFVGFTPNLTCGVWVGLDDPSESLGKGQSGATAALPIWANFMKMVYDSLEIEDVEFEIPAGIVEYTVCGNTKEIATPYCPTKLEEVFRKDDRPEGLCPQHRKVSGWN